MMRADSSDVAELQRFRYRIESLTLPDLLSMLGDEGITEGTWKWAALHKKIDEILAAGVLPSLLELGREWHVVGSIERIMRKHIVRLAGTMSMKELATRFAKYSFCNPQDPFIKWVLDLFHDCVEIQLEKVSAESKAIVVMDFLGELDEMGSATPASIFGAMQLKAIELEEETAARGVTIANI